MPFEVFNSLVKAQVGKEAKRGHGLGQAALDPAQRGANISGNI